MVIAEEIIEIFFSPFFFFLFLFPSFFPRLARVPQSGAGSPGHRAGRFTISPFSLPFSSRRCTMVGAGKSAIYMALQWVGVEGVFAGEVFFFFSCLLGRVCWERFAGKGC